MINWKTSLPVWKIIDTTNKSSKMPCKNARPRYCSCEKKYHHVRIDMSKLDHFIEFINHPYFYQDVSYGTKVLKLDSGETMEMPNVMPTVTLLMMNNQYVQLCQVKKCEPFSRTTSFKILDVREASQRKSLKVSKILLLMDHQLSTQLKWSLVA